MLIYWRFGNLGQFGARYPPFNIGFIDDEIDKSNSKGKELNDGNSIKRAMRGN